MVKLTTLILIFALAGCVSSKPVALPNGEQGVAIECPGLARDITDCMNKASQVCNGPYEILNSEETSTASASTNTYGTGIIATGKKRVLLVQCQ